MEVGDVAVITGLQKDVKLNGKYVVIETPLHETTVPERDGKVRTAMRYGVRIIADEETSGYIEPQYLIHKPDLNPRAVHLHLTGWEGPYGG